jgi:hypothetical protein
MPTAEHRIIDDRSNCDRGIRMRTGDRHRSELSRASGIVVPVLAGGLWLPLPWQTIAAHPELDFIGVHIGHSNLYEHETTPSDIQVRLRKYSLGRVLDALARASALLVHVEPGKDQEVQAQICRGLFGERASDVLRRVDRWVRGPKGPKRVVLFHELQLANMAKLAVLVRRSPPSSEDTTLEALGEALLMMNDLLSAEGREFPGSLDPKTDAGLRTWHRYFLVNGLFHHGDNWEHALVRSYELYLSPHDDLADSGAHLNLPNLVEDITGFRPDHLWAVIVAIAGHWYGMDSKEIHRLHGGMDVLGSLTRHGFTYRESRRFLALLSDSASAMRRRFRQRGCTPDALRPFDLLPLEDRPLIRVSRLAYAPSLKLMMRKLTRGLHHVFMNGIRTREQRDLYLTFMGDVFEEYVRKILARI